jgi:molybdate transport system substrate-binding protein
MKKTLRNLFISCGAVLMILGSLAGCSDSQSEEAELLVSAAASLTEAMGEIQEAYAEENPNVTLTFTFASSGSLATQIEEGSGADVFLSASTKYMDQLEEEGLLLEGSYTDLLQNSVVLVVPEDSTLGLTSFEDVTSDDVTMIGIGNPDSVPVGQYAQEVFESLGIWDEVEAKANFGSDVKTVLSWVETGDVDCGVVYSTDAAVSEGVTVVATAPEGSVSDIIYPAGILADTEEADAAQDFLEFLQSDTAAEIFESYGFVVN